ncbi:MAG: dephospho-CoA kinase [Dehalococcoidales bacterium]|nr:dephospho-CoA kinase [Dehalococcoidales bacterium]
MTRVIGLTGGIGSGKSTVSRYLAELGAIVIDSDKVGHEFFKPHTGAWREVVSAFGQQILTSEGEIDRQKLGKIVFDNQEALLRLNQIMHPRMKELVKTQLDEYRRQGVDVVVLEAAVLIEANWLSNVDEVWVVAASESTVLKRLKEQRGLKEEQILARIRSQLSNEERIKYADAVIYNDGDLDAVRETVRELWQNLHQ